MWYGNTRHVNLFVYILYLVREDIPPLAAINSHIHGVCVWHACGMGYSGLFIREIHRLLKPCSRVQLACVHSRAELLLSFLILTNILMPRTWYQTIN